MRPVWLQKLEQRLGPVAEYYDYVDAESGKEVYVHLIFETGEERAAYKISEGFARLGYGEYDEIPVFSPNLEAVAGSSRVYLCQRERDAIAMDSVGMPSLCVYKATKTKTRTDAFDKFLKLVDGKEVVVCPSGERDSSMWKRNVAKNVLEDKNYFVLDSDESICGLVENGREAVEESVKEMVIPSSVDVLPAQNGFGLGLIDMSKPLNLQRNINGTVSQTSINAMEVLLKDEGFQGLQLKHNKLSEAVEIGGIPGGMELHEMTESDFLKLKSRMELFGITKESKLMDAIGMIAEDGAYHPIIEYLESLPTWDGIDRYSDFLPKYLGAERNELVRETTKMFLTSAVKRVYEPGTKYDVCVVFIGKQGLGKSTLCEKLAHGEKYYADGLQDFGQKAYEIIRGKWIVELAEMKATLSAKSAEEIKQFMGTKQDRHRDIYEKLAKDRPRQCVFVGTANNTECLPYDETGNRRFIPIDCDVERQEIHPLVDENLDAYVDQLWAQALNDYRNGDAINSLDMRFEKELKQNADAHMTQDSRAGVIQAYLDALPDGKVCILQIWREALKEEGFPEKKDSREIGNLMDNKIEGWKRTGKTANFKKYGKKCKYWVRTEFNDHDRNIIFGLKGNPEDFMLVDGELRKQDGTKPKQMTTDDWLSKLKEPSDHNVLPGFIVDTIQGLGVVMPSEKTSGKDEELIFSPSTKTFFNCPTDKLRDTGRRTDLSRLMGGFDLLL